MGPSTVEDVILRAEKPIIALTMGDPAGIGPEVVLGALASDEVSSRCLPLVIGDAGILRRCAASAGLPVPDLNVIEYPSDTAGGPAIDLIHVETPGMQAIEPGKVSGEAGFAANAYVRRACELGLAGEIDAICTAPINKESLRLAGIEHIGHTEMLASYLNAPDPLTLFITGPMRIFVLSRHLSLRQAVDYITEDRVYTFIRLVHQAMTRLGFANPRIGLAALNPHANDGGQFGDEEERHLIPAAQRARIEGANVSDPIGADSIFNMALENRFDCVISLYHDQGHIASKTRDFHGTVTATLNLPVLRTSVDHGTALDIAWQGKANPVSMNAAILAATELLARQSQECY